MNTRWCPRSFCVALWFASGCGAAPSESPGPNLSIADPEANLGGFVVELVAARDSKPAYTAVLGKVYDGRTPSPVVWTVVEDGEGCRLLTPGIPFCDPGCGGVAACVDEGRCQAYPTAQNLGRVQVTGLGNTGFEMDPIAGSYQPKAGLSLPYPPFQEGSAVQMTTSGGWLPAFSVSSRGIASLTVEGPFALTSGQPLPVRWELPSDPSAGLIEVTLDISHHGGTRGKIECSVADSGSLIIPATQITKLMALGVAGFPTILITRVAAGMVALPQGRVGLRVTSAVERAVDIPGLRSCTGNEDCPTGQLCRNDLRCD